MWHIWSEILTEKGDKALLSGNVLPAIEFYNRALTIDPDSVLSYAHLGKALKQANRFEEAADCFRKALSRTPRMPDAQLDLSETYLLLEDPDQAIECLKKLIQSSLSKTPYLSNAFLCMSLAYEKKGETELGKEFRTASKLLSNRSGSYVGRPDSEFSRSTV